MISEAHRKRLADGYAVMQTEHYPHKIAAVYADSAAAADALAALRQAALGDVEIIHLHVDSPAVQRGIEPEQQATRNHMLKDILLGTGLGTAIGAAGAGSIAVILPSLFVSVPVVGPLIIAGYGATLGATVGAIMGLKVKEGLLAGMVQDAVKAGFHVIIVHAVDDLTRERAETVVERTLTAQIRSV